MEDSTFQPGGPESDVNVLPPGRDHWHHFRNDRGDGVLRCWQCEITLEQFQCPHTEWEYLPGSDRGDINPFHTGTTCKACGVTKARVRLTTHPQGGLP